MLNCRLYTNQLQDVFLHTETIAMQENQQDHTKAVIAESIHHQIIVDLKRVYACLTVAAIQSETPTRLISDQPVSILVLVLRTDFNVNYAAT